jgi:hypothetical protein
MSKHTPYRNVWTEKTEWDVRSAEGTILASGIKDEAIAQQFAAAPELLMIVSYLNEHLKEGAQQVYFGAQPGDQDDETTLGEYIKKALAKAEGRDE